MLFSEPKIPQWSFALTAGYEGGVSVLFSEPKIPQARGASIRGPSGRRFSALQRAENSSIPLRRGWLPRTARFQCSSASRKFLNPRASSTHAPHDQVSVLFSEPKIPQFRAAGEPDQPAFVSVLFSEPKIPQSERLL